MKELRIIIMWLREEMLHCLNREFKKIGMAPERLILICKSKAREMRMLQDVQECIIRKTIKQTLMLLSRMHCYLLEIQSKLSHKRKLQAH